MSVLVRLLTTGRSLVDLKNSAVEYRMRRKNLLPKFGGKKNPFAASDSAQSAKPVRPAAVQVDLLKPGLTPAEQMAAKLKETVPLPVIAPAVQTEKANPSGEIVAVQSIATPKAPAVPTPLMPRKPGRFSAWVAKLNPLAWLPRRNAAGKSAIPRFHRPPVQVELSLDNVKVLRNDLSDADVEVVPAKPVAKPPVPARAVRPEAKTDKPSELAEVRVE